MCWTSTKRRRQPTESRAEINQRLRRLADFPCPYTRDPNGTLRPAPTLGDYWLAVGKPYTPGRWRQFIAEWDSPKRRGYSGRSGEAFRHREAARQIAVIPGGRTKVGEPKS